MTDTADRTADIQKSKEQWEQSTLKKVLDRFPERKAPFETVSGEEVERLYTPDAEVIEKYEDKLGFPGNYPYTRGVQPTMYRGRLWTMR
ncbi:MAG: methylmalonyl-CoA mutase family protein, partial [Phycisphaeraceae bacterium]